MRIYREGEGDEWWFPCTVDFLQLAMREAATEYLMADDHRNWSSLYFHYNDHLNDLREAKRRGTYARLTSTCRAIRTAIEREHAYPSIFERHQNGIGIKCTIKADIRTRFDSTVQIFDSIARYKTVLQRTKEE